MINSLQYNKPNRTQPISHWVLIILNLTTTQQIGQWIIEIWMYNTTVKLGVKLGVQKEFYNTTYWILSCVWLYGHSGKKYRDSKLWSSPISLQTVYITENHNFSKPSFYACFCSSLWKMVFCKWVIQQFYLLQYWYPFVVFFMPS